MRVDVTSFGVEPPEKGTTGRAGQTGAARSEATSSAGVDQTRFSFDQKRVQSLEAQVLAQPEIRQVKVQSLQLAIRNGEYSVPAGQIASALVSELTGTQD
jgi:flagellar biosynthesis anti-sigma factor FlgM